MRFVAPFIEVVDLILRFIEWIVILWVILSWIVFFASQSSFRWRNRGLYNVLNQLNDLLTRMAYPFVRPFRRILPPHKMGGIDWSPLLLLLAIYLIRRLLGLILIPAVPS
ncbi:MAG TPA: YggT family protein [Thermoanaerobaculia bacterium]|nr:YggT family protein [Thermoanaerobaculia bacterium]